MAQTQVARLAEDSCRLSTARFTLLVVLQNPYNKGKLGKSGQSYSTKVWQEELKTSRTGKRVVVGLPWDQYQWTIRYTNANPELGNGVHAKLDANMNHLRDQVQQVKPDVVVAFGEIAEMAMNTVWGGPLFAAPHPAHRLVTNRLYHQLKHTLLDWAALKTHPEWKQEVELKCGIETINTDTPRIALRQARQVILVASLKEAPRKSKRAAEVVQRMKSLSTTGRSSLPSSR